MCDFGRIGIDCVCLMCLFDVRKFSKVCQSEYYLYQQCVANKIKERNVLPSSQYCTVTIEI
jgi:hypothetical protein